MNRKPDKLSHELGAHLASIRLAVGKLTGARLPWDAESPFDLVNQGDRMVRCYENWMLDDEQKQMLSMRPEDKFSLYAASYLCDIGLADGQGLPQLAKNLNNDRGRVLFNQSLSTRSCRLIRTRWQYLGVPEKAFVGVISRICLQAGATDEDHFTSAEPVATVTNAAAVNVPLLVAYLKLCRAIDLKTPTTLLQIFSRIPEDYPFSPGRLEAYFNVIDAGAHPYLNGTIRLKIKCTHPEVHKALKHHERSVQQLLEKLNQQVRPRFLYSDVLYEIEPDGYTPMDLKFSVDSSAGLQLFMGNRLYADKRVFLRELIQNAVDACNYRKLFDRDYSPAIAIEFNNDVSTIKVRDNGIGMTRQWIEKYFLAIGISLRPTFVF